MCIRDSTDTVAAAESGTALPVGTDVVLIAGAIVVLAVAARIVIALRPGRSSAPGPGSGTVATEAGAAQ